MDANEATTTPPGSAVWPSVRALTAGLIDYAGLFPPAKLDMPATVANYAEYRTGAHGWMLGRLIVPTARLDEFTTRAADLLPKDADAEPWRLSALTAGADDLDGLKNDLATIQAFNQHHALAARGRAVVDVIELKAERASAIDPALDVIPDAIEPFFEIAVNRDPRGCIAALAGSGAGAKMRTGGVTLELFPTPSDVARFIAGCASAGVPFKATAGLHHPFRHASHTVPGATEFGFVNIFLAAALTLTEQVTIEDLERILAEEIVDHFVFDRDSLGWDGLYVSADDLERTRAEFARGYGSCSFIEPIEDLAHLRLLRR